MCINRCAAALFGVALLAGCSPDQAPSSPSGGVAIDGSWSRLGKLSYPSPAGVGGTIAQRPPPPPPQDPAPDAALDWQYILDAPTNVTPALWVSGAAENNTTDRMYAYGTVGGQSYLGAAKNLYCTGTTNCPTVAWFLAIDSPIDGSAMALAPDGSMVFGVSHNGSVYGVTTATGTLATGWPVSVGANVSWAAPWLDFQASPNQLYVADLSGHITRIDTSTAGVVWRSASLCSAIHASPIVWNQVVWVPCDDGYLHRLNPASGAEYPPATRLCAGTSCVANDAIYSAPFVDIVDNRLLLGVNNRVVVIDISTTGCSTGNVSCPVSATGVGSSAIFHSSPFVDVAAGFVYISFNNKLWRATYNGTKITSPFVATSVPLKGSNKDLGYPKSTPMVFNGHVWVGDGGGYVNRYSSSTFAYENVTPQYGTTIDTTPIVDVAGGNIYYGTNGAGNATMKVNASQGSWVQLAQTW